jgi:TIR domain
VATLFINYRREDGGAEAARIRDRLVTVFGPDNVFMDVDDLKPGQRFDHELAKALDRCNVFLAVIGSRWYDLLYERSHSGGWDYVREEIATALARGITVIPILIDAAALPRAEALPDDLYSLVVHQAYQIRHQHFGRDADALVAALRGKRPTEAVSIGKKAAIIFSAVGALMVSLMLASWFTPIVNPGVTSQDPIVVVNSWWNVDYAKNSCEHAQTWIKENSKWINQAGCEGVTACPEVMTIFRACVVDPTGRVADFEYELITELSANVQCKGVQLVKFDGPDAKRDKATTEAMLKPHWTVMLDFQPGDTKQPWSVVQGIVFMKGMGTAKEIAGSVCLIVTEQGAKQVSR